MADDPITFGAYRLYEQIGRGGMATVWLATREGSSELCVLKRLRGDRNLDGDVPARFVREAHLCTLLDHPNIARVVDAGRVDEDFFIAFEYVSGISVYDVLRALHPKKQVLPFAVTVAIAEQLLAGLAFAHAARDADGAPMNLVHRDLSPANVMLGFDGRVKVIDFGVASAQIDALKTLPGAVFGTMRYMSPDQALGRPLDARSDLYTVGVVLYEMLCGAPVIPRDKKLAWKDALQRIIETWPAPLAEAAPLVPRSLAFAVERAFAKAPEDRWPDAETMRDAVVTGSAELGRVNREGLSRFLQRHFEPERLDREALFLRVAALAGVPELEAEPTRTGVLSQGQDPQMIATRTAPRDAFDLVTLRAEPTLAEPKTKTVSLVTAPLPNLDLTPSLPTRTVRAERARRRIPWTVFGALAVLVAAVTAGIARWRFDAPAPIRVAEAPTPRTPPIEARPKPPGPRIEPRPAEDEPPAAPIAEPDEIAPAPPPEPARTPVVRARVDPPPPQTTPADPLVALLRELEANPRDADLQSRLYRRLVAAARVLPDAGRRQRAESAARRARRSGSLRAFTEAVTLVSRR